MERGNKSVNSKRLLQAADLARKYEFILRDKGHHIALSGSALYGGGGIKQDFDFHVYPHIYDGPVSDKEPEEILSWLPVIIKKSSVEGEYNASGELEVFVCEDKEHRCRVDFFFWNY